MPVNLKDHHLLINNNSSSNNVTLTTRVAIGSKCHMMAKQTQLDHKKIKIHYRMSTDPNLISRRRLFRGIIKVLCSHLILPKGQVLCPVTLVHQLILAEL